MRPCADGDPDQGRHDRFGDRERADRRVVAIAVEVRLGHQRVALDDQERGGAGGPRNPSRSRSTSRPPWRTGTVATGSRSAAGRATDSRHGQGDRDHSQRGRGDPQQVGPPRSVRHPAHPMRPGAVLVGRGLPEHVRHLHGPEPAARPGPPGPTAARGAPGDRRAAPDTGAGWPRTRSDPGRTASRRRRPAAPGRPDHQGQRGHSQQSHLRPTGPGTTAGRRPGTGPIGFQPLSVTSTRIPSGCSGEDHREAVAALGGTSPVAITRASYSRWPPPLRQARRTRRAACTTRGAASAGSPPASPPTPPGGRGR